MSGTRCTSVTPTINALIAILGGSYNVSAPGLAIGSTVTNVANVAFSYTVDGVLYSGAAVAAGTAPGTDVVPQSTFGAVAFDIDAAGTITAVSAPDNATGYTTADAAAADLPTAAAGNARMGYVTATKSDGDFTFGTTALNAANTTVVYVDGDTAGQAAQDLIIT